MRIFDTHAHYDSRGFKEDREEILRYIHEEQDISVGRIVNNGADMASSYTSLKLAEERDFIYAAVGVHPDSAGELIYCPEGCEAYEDEEDPFLKLSADIAAGNVPPNPSELLVSPQMLKLLEDLKEICDLVIIDGTPCELVADSIILSRIVDSCIIITAVLHSSITL